MTVTKNKVHKNCQIQGQYTKVIRYLHPGNKPKKNDKILQYLLAIVAKTSNKNKFSKSCARTTCQKL